MNLNLKLGPTSIKVERASLLRYEKSISVTSAILISKVQLCLISECAPSGLIKYEGGSHLAGWVRGRFPPGGLGSGIFPNYGAHVTVFLVWQWYLCPVTSGLVLAKMHPVQWVTLQSIVFLQGDVVHCRYATMLVPNFRAALEYI